MKSKLLDRILESLAKDLKERGGLDLTETFIDGSFTAAKKRGFAWGPSNAARAPKSWQLWTALVFQSPYAICIESASPHEVILVETTLDQRFVDEQPKRLIGDKAYDSDTLDPRLLEQQGVEMIAPHKTNRKKSPPKMADLREDANADGSWNACLPGFITTGG